MSDSEILQFAPFSSTFDAGFWYQLSKRKLDVYKLDETPIPIFGFYSNNSCIGLPPIANIDYSAFDNDFQGSICTFPIQGFLVNTNTLETFKAKDKKALINSYGIKIWEAIKNGDALMDPSILLQLICLTFADLKKYNFYYWVAFPALTYPEVKIRGKPKKIMDVFDSNQIIQLLEAYDSLSSSQKVAFVISVSDDKNLSIAKLCDFSCAPVSKEIYIGFADPSTYENYPGWPLRNILALVSYCWGSKQKNWNVVCLREFTKDSQRRVDHSIILSIELTDTEITGDCPNVVGWEKNQNKLIPKMVDMSANMDPIKLAEAAVDLNLKLMRWRLLPELKLDDIKSTKCLLFGAGTLGCNVARCLVGWGIRKITFIDNSVVSYSNPVRQTLFCFEDCLKGGRKKAVAAAEAVKKIFPGVDAQGFVLNVPMPGHTVSEKILESVKADVSKIEDLIDAHDVIFLLMDTRESRWLPSLIGASKGKIILNAALGFDTFLVMRHGAKGGTCESIGDHSSKVIDGCDLGCYFCNDIVAPGNSSFDRTLDQQCTVTRLGLSFMAAGCVVELMTSILQHPKRDMAPISILGPSDATLDDFTSELGVVPHQIRGHLDRFQNSILSCRAFDRCIACSPKVLQRYEAEGFDFLLKVFNEPNYLEEVTGLTELMLDTNLDDVLELCDDESV